jgi:hypothetical protein
MRHINQIGIFWQVEISAISKPMMNQGLTRAGVFMLRQRTSNSRAKFVRSGSSGPELFF